MRTQVEGEYGVADVTEAPQAPPRGATDLPPLPRPMPPLPAAGWRVGIGVVWLLAIFLVYYAVHKPLTAADLDTLRAPVPGVSWSVAAGAWHILGELADLLAALWVMLLAGTVGQVLWRALRFPEP